MSYGMIARSGHTGFCKVDFPIRMVERLGPLTLWCGAAFPSCRPAPDFWAFTCIFAWGWG